MKLTHKMFLALAIPFILSTLTQPLLGAFNTGIIGQLGEVNYIAGVSVGVVIFNTMYWMFGFLRVSTTAFSAQAMGQKESQAQALIRPGFIGLCLGLFFIVFQVPIFKLSMLILEPEVEVMQVTYGYYKIVIWGAPFVLLNYVILGWLMGQGRIKQSLIQQIGGNVVNLFLSFYFVLVLDMGVVGLLIATLVAQVLTFLVGSFFISAALNITDCDWKEMIAPRAFKEMMVVNRDLMIRTACLLVQANVFMAMTADFGTVVLSANSILLQVQYLMSYTFDGLANASSVYAGKALGQKDEQLLRQVWQKTLVWICFFIVFWSVIYGFYGRQLIALFTDIPEVLEAGTEFGLWLLIFPVVSGIGLATYGIFTGISYASAVRNSTALSLVLFLGLAYCLRDLENHGLWLALLGFYGGRSLFLIPYVSKYGRILEKEWK